MPSLISFSQLVEQGKDDFSWGWIGTMALWHKGKKVSTGFGKRLRSGEVIKLELNRDAGTLSIWQDGTALGVAFNDLPSGVPLYPAISLFNQVCACCCRMVVRRRSVFEREAHIS
jgi:hypothetical protein